MECFTIIIPSLGGGRQPASTSLGISNGRVYGENYVAPLCRVVCLFVSKLCVHRIVVKVLIGVTVGSNC